MSLVRNILVSVACLAATSSAIPTAPKSSRSYTECAAGTWYYTCGATQGCFSSDPCISGGGGSSSGGAAPTCTNGSTTATQRSMWVVLPSLADSSEEVPYFQVQAGPQDLEMVAVFTGIPAAAKTCRIAWKQGDLAERNFTATENGYVTVRQLDPVAEPITWNGARAAECSSAADSTLTFGNWDDANEPAATHTGDLVDCATDVYFKMAIDRALGQEYPDGEGNVYLAQDDKNGLYIEYTC